jgi:hypothetical protein
MTAPETTPGRDAWWNAVPPADLADDLLFERKQVVALRQVLTEMLTCAAAGDKTLFDDEQLSEWGERAGLEEALLTVRAPQPDAAGPGDAGDGEETPEAAEAAEAPSAGTPERRVIKLLCDNGDVMGSLMRALSDPGSITPRAPLESLVSWQRRAIIEHAAPHIIEAGKRGEVPPGSPA